MDKWECGVGFAGGIRALGDFLRDCLYKIMEFWLL